ncbi:hypothetical protein E3J84_07540 [Candidatus Aerophobetes bacterium]|uniref:Organic solvent tolerance-like N-terminal domain-containing protein n=1 Tax=Aerophobetes bacterium TaxID=2030807 RepID=A0A523RNL3_UNCAE|nr:MAG: hypothetical protein E3J84_07540 [Candidatus Aerophobetes bacterium]
MMGRKIFMISGLILLFSVSLAGAISAAQETIEITSSSIRIDYDSGAVYCKGDAKAVWGGVIMEADEMQIFLTEENTVEKIEARGNVKVIQGEEKREAGGEMAIYTAEDDKFVLENKAYYYDESGNSLLAEKIIIWIEAERLEAEGIEGVPVKAAYILAD